MINTINLQRKQQFFQEYIDEEKFEDIPFTTTEIYIDSINLIDHLQKYELLQTGSDENNIAGLYIGNDPSTPMSDMKKFTNFSSSNSVHLYQCSYCMSALCPFNIVFNINRTQDLVVWSSFRQQRSDYPFSDPPYEPPFQWKHQRKPDIHNSQMESKATWNYDEFGPFNFNYNEYVKAVENLKKEIEKEQV